MTKKGNKIWWKCSRYGFYVYKDMCPLACLEEEIAECQDRRDKPDRSEAPINETLETRLKVHLRKIRGKKKDGFAKIKERAIKRKVL